MYGGKVFVDYSIFPNFRSQRRINYGLCCFQQIRMKYSTGCTYIPTWNENDMKINSLCVYIMVERKDFIVSCQCHLSVFDELTYLR